MNENWNRIFDQVKPSPEQKEAMLSRLLEPERKVTPMKKLKKLAVIGIAAALMAVACAAAVATGIDQRLAEYFGAGPGQAEQLSGAAATQDPASHTYDSGWTVQISQVLSDRYVVAALLDFAAPKGTVLPIPEGATAERELTLMVDYYIEDKDGNLIGSLKDAPSLPSGFDAEDGSPLFSMEDWNGVMEGDGLANCSYLESSDPERGCISVLWEYVLGARFQEQGFTEEELLGAKVSIVPKGVTFSSTYETIYFADEDALWSYTVSLPERDSGSVYMLECPLNIGRYKVELKTMYLSPLELVYEFQTAPGTSSDYGSPLYDKDARAYAINMADGSSIPVKDAFDHSAIGWNSGEGINHIGLYPVELIDPSQVVSFSLFGQTFDLK